MWRPTLVMLSVVLLPSLAAAQVNTEKLRKTRREDGFSGSVDASLALRRGNVDRVQIGSGLRLQYETLKPRTSTSAPAKSLDLFFLVASQTFANKRVNDETTERFINRGFGHLRWTRMWLDRLGSEVFGQIEYNEFLRLESRLLGGAGARFVVSESKVADIYVGGGYMIEREILDRLDTCEEVPTDRCLNHRLTGYLAFVLKPFEKASIINTAYIQPRLDDFSDYRLISEGEISVAVGGGFSFGFALTLRFDNQPPEDVEQLDLTMNNKLKFAF